MKKAELIFVPLPGTSHLAPALEFARRLIDRDDQISITVLVMKLPFGNDQLTKSLRTSTAASHSTSIRFIDLPQVDDLPPSQLLMTSPASYFSLFTEKHTPHVRNIIRDIIVSSSSSSNNSVRVTGLVVDWAFVSMFDVAIELNLPCYAFSPVSVGYLSLFRYLSTRYDNDRELQSSDSDLIVPGFVNPVPVSVLPLGLFNRDDYKVYFKIVQRLQDVNGIIANTFSELEQYSVNSFSGGGRFPPVYTVGPLLNLIKRQPANNNSDLDVILKWLDDQPECSVVFLCFGTAGSFSPAQVKETATGLEQSECRFLWSLRVSSSPPHDHQSTTTDVDDLPEGFMERVRGRGMHFNAFTLVKELGLSVEMRLDSRKDPDGDHIVSADEIAEAVRCVMDGDSEIRKKVKEMSGIARKSMLEGGSSFDSIGQFIVEGGKKVQAYRVRDIVGILSLLRYLSTRHDDDDHEFQYSDSDLIVPGFVNSVPVSVLLSTLFVKDGYKAYVKLARRLQDVNVMILNTFPELEKYSVNSFSGGRNPPLFAVGPLLHLYVLESLWYGVPIVWPLYAEQQFNAFTLVKELGLSVEIRLDSRKDPDGDHIVSADEIAKAVRCVMDGDSDITKKVKEMSKIGRKSTLEGVSLCSHMVATLEFAKSLMDRDDRISITVLVMKLPYGIRFIDVDHVDLPPVQLLITSPESYFSVYAEKNTPHIRNIVTDIMSSSHSQYSDDDSVSVVTGLVVDFAFIHMIDAAIELGLPSYLFYVYNIGVLSLTKYLSTRHDGHEFQSSDSDLIIPGFVNPVPVSVLISGMFNKDGYTAYVKHAQRIKDVDGIIVNTFSELEQYSVNSFSGGGRNPPVYTVGPLINSKRQPNLDLEILNWLNDQPESSVVFLCFGTIGGSSPRQVKEIATGLEQSECRFLWSLPASPLHQSSSTTNVDDLPEGFMERARGRGMICGWVPQVEVLAHKAIVGFVSHCGWNSILESLWYGVPIVTWPLYAEQQLNAFTMVKEFGLAVEMRLDSRRCDGDDDHLVMADEIARAIRCVMDGDNEVRKKVKEMSVIARKSTLEGGSSFNSLRLFIDTNF
ncbi:hypothetical protein QYF36_011128 [Acer negundo]|nr:hypothetical protein QYF36_011128 [Acer negundo]